MDKHEAALERYKTALANDGYGVGGEVRTFFFQKECDFPGGGIPFVDDYLHKGCRVLRTIRAPDFITAVEKSCDIAFLNSTPIESKPSEVELCLEKMPGAQYGLRVAK